MNNTPRKFLCAAGAALSALGAGVPAAAMNITFVGDSITQGGSFLDGSVASYRYSLFKNFVDNEVDFRPMGTTNGASKNVDVSSLTPDYRGVKFENVSEAAASARAYQYSGHEEGSRYRADPGTVYPAENRGPVSVKLGLTNEFTGTTDTYYNGSTLTTYAGDTYASLYGNEKTDTLCVMIGINDLYDMSDSTYKADSYEQIAGYVEGIVKAYQAYNPDIDVYVFELLPTGSNNGTGTTGLNNYSAYNEVLRELAESWSTETSKVTMADISTGFYAEDGAMIDTNRGAHPNAQGELIVAGNIARVLGIGQRTAGLERRGRADFSSHVAFEATAGGSVKVVAKNASAGTESEFTLSGFSSEGNTLGVNEAGSLTMSTQKSGGNDVQLTWNDGSAAREFTVCFSVKMTARNSDENAFGVIAGNGESAGLLYVRECGIFWNGTLLYGSATVEDTTHATFSATSDFVDLTLVWLDDSHDVESGFYVWLGDQLIGEALDAVSGVATHKDKLLFGDIGNSWFTDCEIASLSFEYGSAYAPLSAIPEPSAFGLLAGAGALALAAARRRRNKR